VNVRRAGFLPHAEVVVDVTERLNMLARGAFGCVRGRFCHGGYCISHS
jgi:hypothetical protein